MQSCPHPRRTLSGLAYKQMPAGYILHKVYDTLPEGIRRAKQNKLPFTDWKRAIYLALCS